MFVEGMRVVQRKGWIVAQTKEVSSSNLKCSIDIDKSIDDIDLALGQAICNNDNSAILDQ
jgi:hypothetical protein